MESTSKDSHIGYIFPLIIVLVLNYFFDKLDMWNLGIEGETASNKDIFRFKL